MVITSTKLRSLLERYLYVKENRLMTNGHSSWAIVVNNLQLEEIAGHVPDDLARAVSLLTSGLVMSMKCEVTGMSKAVEDGVWVQVGGIVIPCTYVCPLWQKLERPHVRGELRKYSRKSTCTEETGEDHSKEHGI